MGTVESKGSHIFITTPGEPKIKSTVDIPAIGICPNPIWWKTPTGARERGFLYPDNAWQIAIGERDKLDEQSEELCSMFQRMDLMDLAKFGKKRHGWAAAATPINAMYDTVKAHIREWRNEEFNRIRTRCHTYSLTETTAMPLMETFALHLRDLYLTAAETRYNGLLELLKKPVDVVAAITTASDTVTPN